MKKGKLVLNVARLLEERGVKHKEAWLKRHGFSRSEARTLLEPEHKFLALCQRVFEVFVCMPDDLLDWEGDADSHLHVLRKRQPKHLEQLFKGKSEREVAALLEELERKAREGGG
jgi:hypothetical protein